MSIYAEVTINLKDGRQVGTSDITQGSIRDAVLEIMKQCVPSEAPYGSVIVPGDSPLLQEMAQVFADNTVMEFEAVVCDSDGIPGALVISEDRLRSFKEDLLDGSLILSAIEQDEYSSACLPSWAKPIYEANFSDMRNVKIFLRYCDLFMDGKILFGVQTKNIASIKLKLS